jgi:hypothetical protein
MLDVGRPLAGPTKFRFNKTQLGLNRALQSQSHADRHSRTTKLIGARQDVATKSRRVNRAVTRLLNGCRSLAHWLSDRRRLLCNRAGSAAEPVRHRFHFLDPVGTDEPCKDLVSA